MTYDDWTPIFKRLCQAKDRTPNGEQGATLFEVLKDFPTPCVHQACFRASREVSGWPKSERLVELAMDERRKVTAAATICDVCHGEVWVDAAPRENFGVTYQTVERCPQCWAFGG
jgi:hypothetical protein